ATFFGTTTTPSSSATTTSPGSTLTPAQTTGTLTAPSVAFTVPFAEMAFDQTGKRISEIGRTSRQPASRTSPTTPRARSAVASNSPNIPSELSAVQPTTRTSPFWHCSTATWIIQLSPGCASTVTADPAICAPAQTGRI